MDISIVCRSCMKEVASWEKENFDQTSIDMFCFCTNILITDCDKLPRQFCYDCFIKIESSYTFIKEAQRVNITLKNIVSRSQTSIIVELDNNQKIYDKENNTSSFTFHNISLDENNIHLDENTIFHDEAGNVKEDDSVPSQVQGCLESIPYTLVTEEVKNIGNNIKEPDEKEVDIPMKKKIITKPEQTNGHKTKNNVCPVCGKSFTFKAWLDRHVRGEHESTYTCEHCPKTFSKPSHKSKHLVSHSTERQHVCSVCNARFKRRKQLTVHIRNHNSVRPHCCPECGVRFKQKSTLKSHMLLHEESKPFLCSICGWSFAQAGNLQAHLRTHTGEKPFRCEQCPFTSATSSNLARHSNRHTDTRKHVCQHCRRGFYDGSGLARHKRSHTGEQPFKCPYCSRAFVDSWKRKSHLMSAHKFALRDIPRMPRDPGPVAEEGGTTRTGG